MFDLSVSRRYYLYGMGFRTGFTFPEGIKVIVLSREVQSVKRQITEF